MVGSGTPAGALPERAVEGHSISFGFTALDLGLPSFAESPIHKSGDECEKGIRRVGGGESASAGSAEGVKMPGAVAKTASLLFRCSFSLRGCPVVKTGFGVIDLAEQFLPLTVLFLG